MRKLTIVACIIAIGAIVASGASAGPVDKITGDFVRVDDSSTSSTWLTVITAHEANKAPGEKGYRPQKGDIFAESAATGGTWTIDLGDSASCVVVDGDGRGRVAGIVTGGSRIDLQGKGIGLDVFDNGEPAADVDKIDIYLFGVSSLALENFCKDGLGDAFPSTISEGNLQVHNYDGDGD